MIALLDPALFVFGVGPGPLLPDDEKRFAELLAAALGACRAANASIGRLDGYWERLSRDFIAPLERRVRTPEARAAIAEVKKLSGAPAKFPPAAADTRVWGFKTMFGQTTLMAADWEDLMADAAARLISAGKQVMMLVRLIEGRNEKLHQGKQNVVIRETTRWRLYVRPPGFPAHARIDCVRNRAQILRPWTIRYDERLPTEKDGVRYPFCLLPDWWRGRIKAVQTTASVPAWIDAAGRGWSRPNISRGAGYHWDVFFSEPRLIAAIGVDQLNIVEVGAPAAEGTPGSLHHVPSKKKATIVDAGWGC